MTDKKISELTNITGANVDDANDELAIVDASATETKAITRAELFSNVSLSNGTIDGTTIGGTTAASGTFTDITVDEATLTAIAESKADTAVDVFVYDTSQDSDGGAWRHRTQHTSWYNETLNTATRGPRREFPAVAVIVAESNKVTIYDGDDPALPMWMVFNSGNTSMVASSGLPDLSSVVMRDGEMVVGSGYVFGGVSRIQFPADTAYRHRSRASANNTQGKWILGGIADRNQIGGFNDDPDDAARIVDEEINDVAMTVLPDAPIDPATGLPVPTIAVATAGGVSIINDDGTVADSSETVGMAYVSFGDENRLFYNDDGSDQVYYADTYDSDGFSDGHYDTDAAPYTLPGNISGLVGSAFGHADGLTFLKEDQATKANGVAAYLTSTYNTGWMPGDIKGAFLSDTDDTDLVGSGELVTNGTFDSGITGWSGARTNETLSHETDKLRITADASGAFGAGIPLTGLTVGAKYVAQLECVTDSVNGFVFFRVDGEADLNTTGDRSRPLTTGETGTIYFTAGATTEYVGVIGVASAASEFIEIDNVSVKLADEDRSVNSKGLVINGTITRTFVDEV